VWWISYRGEGKHGLENIGVFEDDGTPRKEHPLLLDPAPDAHPLHIARGFALVGDDLYIANAWRKDSHIARYRRHGDMFHFAGIVVETKHVSAMVHPFDVELGDDGRIYVSCQDTNTVVAILPKTRRPAAVAAHLRKKFPDGNFLPGTLVASALGHLPEVGDRAPLDVPSPQGLKVVLDVHGKPRHSVRGIIVHRGHLYVADEAGDAVKIFEVASGKLVARIKGKRLMKPVHLVLHGETLYIGAAGTGSILAFEIPKKAPHGRLRAPAVVDGKLKAPSGFAIGPDGDLYVAERLDQRVRRFSVTGKKKGTFIGGLPDMPEFLVHVPDQASAVIPRPK
jgi:DNA-binding beta-propeller fold protein YncE